MLVYVLVYFVKHAPSQKERTTFKIENNAIVYGGKYGHAGQKGEHGHIGLWVYELIITGLKYLSTSRVILNGNNCFCLKFSKNLHLLLLI